MGTRLQVIGGGKMGEALLGGLLADGWASAEQLHVVEPDPDRRTVLAGLLPGVSLGEAAIAGVDTLVAVKPHVVADVCADLADLGVPRVLSIAAGVTTAAMEAVLWVGCLNGNVLGAQIVAQGKVGKEPLRANRRQD